MAPHMHRTKPPPPPPAEMTQIANQIHAMPVAPAAESQKREIVAKLNELAAQMKHWATQVEGFASHLSALSVQPHRSQSPSDPHFPRPATASGQPYIPYPTQQYPGAPQYQFQYQSSRPSSASTPDHTVSPVTPTGATQIPDDAERAGKRRRTDPVRRKKDPLAPKRPPSAYILYQNDVRKQMQDKYPEMQYSEVLGKISESWQTLEEGKKKVYLDMVERDKLRYEGEKLRYNSGQDVPSKPTPRRPLSALRAASDPDADVEAEPEPADGEAEEERVAQEQPDAKRSKTADSHGQQPATQNAESQSPPQPAQSSESSSRTASTQSQTPATVGISLQQSPQPHTHSYSPSAQQTQCPQHIPVPQPSPYGSLQPQSSPQAADASPPIPQTAAHSPGTHTSPQAAHATPQIAHTSPRPQVPHGSPQVAPPSPQAADSAPQQALLQPQPRHPVPLVPMPHLTQVSQPGMDAPNEPAA